MGFPLAGKESPALSLPLAVPGQTNFVFFSPWPVLLSSVSILPSLKGIPWRDCGTHAQTGGSPQAWAFLSVDNIAAALTDWLSRELRGKAVSKQLKCFILGLLDKPLILSSSVSWCLPMCYYGFLIFIFLLSRFFFRFYPCIRQCKQLFFKITSKYPDLLKSLCKLLLISLAFPVLVIRDVFLVQTSQVTACES